MYINLSPQRGAETLSASKQGDVLTINGVVYDFSVIPEGASLPANATDCPFLLGNIERVSGDLILTLLLPTTETASQAANFPAALINPPDGVLELPV